MTESFEDAAEAGEHVSTDAICEAAAAFSMAGARAAEGLAALRDYLAACAPLIVDHIRRINRAEE